MAINEVPVDGAFQDQFGRCIEVQPVNITDDDGKDTGVQRTDYESGYPVWQLSVPIKRDGRKPDLIHVKVPELSAPDLEGKTPVFGALQAKAWSMLAFDKTANGGLSWRAESVGAKEDRPSSARKAAPPAPAAAESKG